MKTLKDKNVDRGLLEIIKSDKMYYIAETKDLQSSFDSADQTIYWNLLLSAKVFPSDIKNRLNPHDEDSAFSFICFLLPKHINDEQKFAF